VLPTSLHSFSGLQCVAVCYSVFQCVAVSCSVLQCLVAVSCCSVFKDLFLLSRYLLAQNIRIYQKGSNSGKSSSASCVAMCGSVVQCFFVFGIVLQCVAMSTFGIMCGSVLQCVAVCGSVLHCVAMSIFGIMCCSVLQCVAVCCRV